MLDSNTKRRIDTCRDILVGKVPDPKSQVEQITIALIYKFMDDMDAEAEALGGERSFFTGEFAKYGWSKLMAPGMGGFDVLSLYSEAIQKMNENPGIPALFRDIFKNAYLPYRDPETLRIFLKEINTFTYDHSERLGDAFEYLLSVLGSQGEAGQFRTPRHIIDFMVEIIAPKKDETILDPACGTAGFLISAYKHILKHNTKSYQEQQDREAYDEKNVPVELLSLDSPLRYSGDLLNPDDRKRLAASIHGYDISPDMVRLSLVNMYLHGFTNPHIEEYDTLTSDEKWNQLADVILANPPFMSPKGGIKPHKRFSVASKRSEVLFVDYIAEHLTPNGRAAIVVPEGIIFQSQTAYKQLREMLVKGYLVAVVSLPAGVFNPYSGVKTSILVFDKRLVKKSDDILFIKIDNDGFNLGAQRRPIDKNDLPAAVEILKVFCQTRDSGNPDDFDVSRHRNALVVSREQIGGNGEWNLSGERYVIGDTISSQYDLVPLGEVCELIGGGTPSKSNQNYWSDGSIKWISSKHINERGYVSGCAWITDKAVAETSTKIAPKGSVILITRVSVGKFAFADDDYAINQDLTAVIPKNPEVLSSNFLYCIANELAKIIERNAQGIGVRGVTRKLLAELIIPLPPLEVQKEIVAEIEGYQKIIDGARQVVENYQPRIPIHPDWPEHSLGEVCRFIDYRGKTPKKTEHGIPLITAKNVRQGYIDPEPREFIAEEDYEPWMTRGIPENGDVLFTMEAPLGNVAEISTNERFALAQRIVALCPNRELLIGTFLRDLLLSKMMRNRIIAHQTGSTVYGIKAKTLKAITIPIPDLDTQRAIIAKIEAEQGLVDANKELIHRFEEKIKQTINRVWSEAE